MHRLFSLTTRLSLLFSATMLAIWLLVGVLLLQALDQHFAHQDQEELQGKLILTRSLLNSQQHTASPDWSMLKQRLDDALSGHGHLYITLQDPRGQLLAEAGIRHPQPEKQTSPPPQADIPLAENWTEQGTHYRSRTERVRLAPSWPDAPESVVIRATLDTSYHQHFIDGIRRALIGFTLGIALLSIVLGWIASRIGLAPLRTLASVSSRVSAARLNHRLPLADAPTELHVPIKAFNAMLDRLEDSFQRLSAFSSDIAHELRTPVNSLMMHTQVALAHERDAAEYKEALYANLEAAERLARMIGEMLFLAQSEQGKLPMQPIPLELADELDELLEFFEPLASEQQLHFRRQGNACLLGDRSMLQRAFSNLLTNAIRYTPALGEIRISVLKDSQGITVEVANPGPVIPPEQWPRLFDRFYRADSARQSVTEGTGLGLAIARAIITAHNGTLSVHSDERETCFTAHFPGDGPFTTAG
ncbi:heavy metal sensor histidine kinase [Oceanisphaera sp. KMM 10153]|uniref:heavy metal sensor histidine kinase n=1 Tax=Oceanisphaera submarina TaxID=3390193 RepID=UPI0039760680